jgi:fucose 4-O-acetylase-like acetyltransferase
MFICYAGKWGMYSWRKWSTGRRSYEFLQDFFSYAVKDGWWIRLAVWGVALLITFAVIALIPDKDLGFITTIGARTLSVYFWHRPLCYLFRTWKVLPSLYMLFGGTYNEAVAGQIRGHAFAGGDMKMLLPFVIYCLIGAAMTAFFSLRIFEHPTGDLMKLGARIAKAGSKK